MIPGVAVGAGDFARQRPLVDIPDDPRQIGEDIVMMLPDDLPVLKPVILQVTPAYVDIAQVPVKDGNGAVRVFDDVAHQVMGMGQVFLGALALRDVHQNPLIEQNLPLGVSFHHGVIVHPAHFAVFCDDPIFLLGTNHTARRVFLHLPGNLFQVFRMDDRGVGNRPGQQFLCRITELAYIPGNQFNRPSLCRSPPEEHDRAVFDHKIGLPERFLDPQALGDVPVKGNAQETTLVFQIVGGHLNGEEAPVFRAVTPLE
ncbi:MAG: hypothetical protein A4E72_01787 [Syntrophus sp. PtaU1.Bin208]|nr:MAG: hypothetical protein A4E72_01787 [Syntrophus sp. PtaU1.Bin208]